jgi:uncharacterized protein YqeY
MKGLAALAALAGGYVKGDQLARQTQAAEDEHQAKLADAQWQQYQRGKQRDLDVALSNAIQPATVNEGAGGYTKPDTADNRDVGQPGEPGGEGGPALSQGVTVNGQAYQSAASGQAAADTYNAPGAAVGRQAAAYAGAGKPMEAMQLQSAAGQLQQQKQALADDAFRRKVVAAGLKGPQGLADLATATEAGPFKGVKASAVMSPDKSQFTFHTVNDDGTTTPTPYTFSNDQGGMAQASALFDTSISPEHRVAMFEADRKNAAQVALETSKLDETKRHNLSTETNQAVTAAARKQMADQGNVAPAMTQDAVDNAAARYNVDGTMPTMGMGKAAADLRAKILNRAAELSATDGMSPEQRRTWQIGNSANKSALTKLEGQAQIVGAFEKTFNANANMVDELSTKNDRTGVPIINKWIQAGKRSVTGDPDISAFDLAVKSTVNEYTKIVSGSMGNTPMAESEIKKVDALLNTAQTPEQVKAVLDRMRQETGNRMKGFEDQRGELMNRMTRKPAGGVGAPGSSPGGAAKSVSSKAEVDALPSGTLFVGPDGVTRRKP